jgi:hypothetical protein
VDVFDEIFVEGMIFVGNKFFGDPRVEGFQMVPVELES